MTSRPNYPVYGYSAYGRIFRVDQATAEGAYLVTVRDAVTRELLASASVPGPGTVEAFKQVHRFENEAAATGAKR